MPIDTPPSPDSFQYILYAVFAIVGGLVTWVFKGFSAKDLVAWWNRPRLSLAISDPAYSESVPTKEPMGYTLSLGVMPPTGHRIYHLDVTNRGRTTATSWEAELVHVEQEELGQRKPVPSAVTLCFLPWTGTDGTPIHIDIPGRICRRRPGIRVLDLCTQELAHPGLLRIFRAAGPTRSAGLQTDYGPGTYYFTVCVRSKQPHVRPATLTIRVQVDDSGKPLRVEAT